MFYVGNYYICIYPLYKKYLILKFPYRSDFSLCSGSCPGATKLRFRDHVCTDVREDDVETCDLPEDNWGLWHEWSSCSTTCTGVRSRNRFDLCDSDRDSETEACVNPGKPQTNF